MDILRLKRGDPVIKTLESKIKSMRSGQVIGLGALSWVRLKVYDLEKKEYNEIKIDGPMELVSFTAVIAQTTEGKTGLHAHAVVSLADFSTKGGHLEEAEVAATFEAIIIESEKKVQRYFDRDIGLNLIKS